MNFLQSSLAPRDGDRQIGDYVSCSGADEYSQMMQEIDFLLEKEFPLGLALMTGRMDQSFLQEIKAIARGQADYIAWVAVEPFVVAVFHRRLFDELHSMWLLVAGTAQVACGAVLSEGFTNHGELLFAARTALRRAIVGGDKLVVLDPAEASRAVAGEAAGPGNESEK